MTTTQKPISPGAGWMPASTAPKDGSPFMWLHFITIITNPETYEPRSELVRRFWIREEELGRQGDGFWMGQYGGISDNDLNIGWWHPLEFEPITSPIQ